MDKEKEHVAELNYLGNGLEWAIAIILFFSGQLSFTEKLYSSANYI